MERAKRLELLRSILQDTVDQSTCDCHTANEGAGGAHAPKAPSELDRWSLETEEVLAAWPALATGIRQGVVALVRSQFHT